MNPLSALSSLPMPDLQNLSSMKGMGDKLTGGLPIPPGELQKLADSIAPHQLTPLEPSSIGGPLPGGGAGNPFGDMLGQLVNEVNAKSAIANQATTGLLSGQNVSLHQTMIAMQEASVSFQLMVEVRNKLLDSYQELMRMQI
jgi:flagellar hook-basal body complex protein FliE